MTEPRPSDAAAVRRAFELNALPLVTGRLRCTKGRRFDRRRDCLEYSRSDRETQADISWFVPVMIPLD
jgi:hypothetical protein